MPNSEWTDDIESIVYSRVKYSTMELKEKYPKIRYTTNNENVEPITIFPTVYIHEESSIPSYMVLERDFVEEVLSTFLVKITVNTEKTDAKYIGKKIKEAMIKLGFEPISNPIINPSSNMYISNARYRRRICYDDKL